MKVTFEEFAKAIEHLDYEIELQWENSKHLWCATLKSKPIEFAGLKSQVYSSVLIEYLNKFKLSIEIRNTDKNCIRIHSTGRE